MWIGSRIRFTVRQPTAELLSMPHWFLPDSGHSCGFRYHSSGIHQPKFRNIDIPVLTPEQSPEWTGTEWHWNAWLEWMLKIAKYGKFCIFTRKIVIKLERNYAWCSLVVLMLGHWLCGLCAFLNIVVNASIAWKSEKIRKNNRHNMDCYWQCWVL